MSDNRSFEDLVELVGRLRAPDGCPWDREQTYETLRPMLVEEAYEVVEAIDERVPHRLAEELGDLLFQIVFLSQMARERGDFDVVDVITHIHTKMIRRHPHVFGDAQIETAEEVLRNWEELKRNERREAGREHPQGMLEGVATHLPGLLEAYSLTERASRVGFDWPSVGPCLDKLSEEIDELRHELQCDDSGDAARRRLESEVGDLLFAAVNVARLLGVDPETALKSTNRKFRRRFRHVEFGLEAQGRSPAEASLEEMDALWEEAKAGEGQ
jgi:MazG family protein